MYRYGGSKKMQRRSRRLHNEAKDEPRPWWRDDDYVWEPTHIKVARDRARLKRAEQKHVRVRGRWPYYNDFGVTCSASKSTFHRRHQRKPYERPTKT
jgi:hypothetical protein